MIFHKLLRHGGNAMTFASLQLELLPDRCRQHLWRRNHSLCQSNSTFQTLHPTISSSLQSAAVLAAVACASTSAISCVACCTAAAFDTIGSPFQPGGGGNNHTIQLSKAHVCQHCHHRHALSSASSLSLLHFHLILIQVDDRIQANRPVSMMWWRRRDATTSTRRNRHL
jgi:hypothetical protein